MFISEFDNEYRIFFIFDMINERSLNHITIFKMPEVCEIYIKVEYLKFKLTLKLNLY